MGGSKERNAGGTVSRRKYEPHLRLYASEIYLGSRMNFFHADDEREKKLKRRRLYFRGVDRTPLGVD